MLDPIPRVPNPFSIAFFEFDVVYENASLNVGPATGICLVN